MSVRIMAPTYKVYYFDMRGRCEPIRFLLSYGGQEFEDVRIDREQWPETKKTMPFGKVPVLEVDGKRVSQSGAICRYLGKQFNLAGSNDWDNLQIDIVADTFGDFKDCMVKAYMGTVDEEKKKKNVDEFIKETLPYYMKRFDDMVKTNGGYFVNGKLTWIDIAFTANTDSLGHVLSTNWLNDYPNVKALTEKVLALPAIKAWVEKRPQTDHTSSSSKCLLLKTTK